MQVLNLYGKIKTTMLSEKLGLCLSNIPKSHQDDIIDAIKNEFVNNQARSIYTKFDIFNDNTKNIVNKLICIRTKGFNKSFLCTKNQFCNPVDQIEYGEKLIRFISFIIYHCQIENISFMPRIIYDDHFFHSLELTQILPEIDVIKASHTNKKSINDLIIIGRKVDVFIKTEIDFKKLDYIISSINAYHERDYNAVHFMNTVNLLTLLLVHPKNKGDLSELEFKLPYFIENEHYSELDKKQISQYIKKLRNKIAHGAFKDYEKLCEQFAQKIMKNFWFDYSEFDRETWIISNLCSIVDNCLAKILWLMLDNKMLLEKIQYNKIDLKEITIMEKIKND